MQLVSIFAGIAIMLQAATAAVAANATPTTHGVEIRVEAGDWGGARPQDIEAVLTTVAESLLPAFPQRAGERIAVAYSAAGPSVLLGKNRRGAQRVLLSVQDTRWDQFAYQFSHELCHIFTNHEHRAIAQGMVDRDHQWFEESLCEAVSLFALERLATRWEHSPPYPGWQSYAPAFREYARQLRNERHRRLPPDETLDQWFSANREALARDPYLRQKNELLAAHLLPLFETIAGGLEAVGYLNAEPSVPTGFAAYLESWRDCCPATHRAFVIQVMALLGEGRERPLPPNG